MFPSRDADVTTTRAEATWETVHEPAPWTIWMTSGGVTAEMTTHDVQMSQEEEEALMTGGAVVPAVDIAAILMTADDETTPPMIAEEETEAVTEASRADAAVAVMI